MTNGPVQEDTSEAHPGRAGAGLCRRAASQSTVPRAPQARHETEPVVFPSRRQGHVGVAGVGPGACVCAARVTERGCDAPQARHETEPVFSPVHRRGYAAVVGVGPEACVCAARAAGRGHDVPLGQTVGDNRRATLRCWAASLTETAGRAPIERHGRRAGKGA